jgi:hypothetical protein
MMFSKRFAAIAASAIAVLSLGFSAPAGAAQAQHHRTGFNVDFTMVNGNTYSMGQPNDVPFNPINQVAQPGRTFFFSNDTTFQGSPAGLLSFPATGDDMAANNACNGVTIKSSDTSNGTVWAIRDIGGAEVELVNRYCSQQNGSDTLIAYADNVLGHQWKFCNLTTGGCGSGKFYKLAD